MDTRFYRSQRISLGFHQTYSTLWFQQVSVKDLSDQINVKIQEPQKQIKGFVLLSEITSPSKGLSGFPIFGVPIHIYESNFRFIFPDLKSPLTKLSHFDLFFGFFTFEAFLKTSSSLEVLIEMWSAIENSFKGVVIAKLSHQEEAEQSNL